MTDFLTYYDLWWVVYLALTLSAMFGSTGLLWLWCKMTEGKER